MLGNRNKLLKRNCHLSFVILLVDNLEAVFVQSFYQFPTDPLADHVARTFFFHSVLQASYNNGVIVEAPLFVLLDLFQQVCRTAARCLDLTVGMANQVAKEV